MPEPLDCKTLTMQMDVTGDQVPDTVYFDLELYNASDFSCGDLSEQLGASGQSANTAEFYKNANVPQYTVKIATSYRDGVGDESGDQATCALDLNLQGRTGLQTFAADVPVVPQIWEDGLVTYRTDGVLDDVGFVIDIDKDARGYPVLTADRVQAYLPEGSPDYDWMMSEPNCDDMEGLRLPEPHFPDSMIVHETNAGRICIPVLAAERHPYYNYMFLNPNYEVTD